MFHFVHQLVSSCVCLLFAAQQVQLWVFKAFLSENSCLARLKNDIESKTKPVKLLPGQQNNYLKLTQLHKAAGICIII